MLKKLQTVWCLIGRDIIKECVNAGKDDMVIFTGSGVTGAIHKLIHILNVLDNVNRTVSVIIIIITIMKGFFETTWNIMLIKKIWSF